MEKNEKTMLFLEEHIPELAESAIKQAYWRALASGYSVLVARNGYLLEIHPDGAETVIKKLPPLTPVTPGQRLEIQ